MGERMTPAELDAAEALANAVPPGPWRVDESGWGVNEINGMCVVADLGAWLEPGGANVKVATFLAAARELVPRLVAEVRARDTELAATRASEARLVVELAQRDTVIEAVREGLDEAIAALNENDNYGDGGFLADSWLKDHLEKIRVLGGAET